MADTGGWVEKLMVVLRDGRKLIGVLRSWDQYANLVLQDTLERIFVGVKYADIKHGLFIVRGENVLLLGEIDLDQDDVIPEPFTEVPAKEIRQLQREEEATRKKKEKSRGKLLRKYGFERDFGGDAII
ncbi:hypothetical protein BT63DRAFT_429709 [Microthyrium microscopicum]|uniref:U6 snRNA-associated Sm-like protein LSm1 n=1 Tax=Microthyrium microscopicum TaxID=703497 RepID=A0A6A6TXL5_9PEZI|nr:hypothetical protein BT63DRAFT_429709 [Microthyrium microscopicum]